MCPYDVRKNAGIKFDIEKNPALTEIDSDVGIASVNVRNVLNEEKKKQVIALGQLGWALRRNRGGGVRRETASGYLKPGGIANQGRVEIEASVVTETGQRRELAWTSVVQAVPAFEPDLPRWSPATGR